MEERENKNRLDFQFTDLMARKRSVDAPQTDHATGDKRGNSTGQYAGSNGNARAHRVASSSLGDVKTSPVVYNQSPPVESFESYLKDFLATCFQFRFVLISVALGLVGIAAYHTHQLPDTYTASTKLLIRKQTQELAGIDDKQVARETLPISTWAKIVSSEKITRRVSDNLPEPVSPAVVKSMLSVDIERGEEAILNISVTSQDSSLSARVANAVTTAANEYDSQLYSARFQETADYLQSQLQLRETELKQLNAEIDSFFQSRPLDTDLGSIDSHLKTIDDYRKTLENARVSLASVTASIETITRQLNGQSADYIPQNHVSEPLTNRLVEAELELAEARARYGEYHPRISVIKENIARTRRLIKEGVADSVLRYDSGFSFLENKLVAQLLAAQNEKTVLVCKIEALENLIDKYHLTPDEMSRLHNYERQKKSLETLLEHLETQIDEAQINTNVKNSRVVQLEAATVPAHPDVKPYQRNIILTAVFGLILCGGMMYVFNSIDTHFRTVHQFSQGVQVPLWGVVPRMKQDPLTVFKGQGNEFKTDHHLGFMRQILITFLNNRTVRKHFIGVNSNKRGEGKTSLSLMLALSSGLLGYRTVIVDMNLTESPTSRGSSAAGKGIFDVLAGTESIQSVLQRTSFKNVFTIPNGSGCGVDIGAFNRTHFAECLADLDFDLILFDTTALEHSLEAFYSLVPLDGLISVVDLRRNMRSELQTYFSRVQQTRTPVLGVVLNRVKPNPFDPELGRFGL
jgi:capsular polysaccharide biosynthesis protein